MPGSATLVGKDVTTIDGRIISGMPDADTVTIEFSDNLVEGKVGKNGNVIYAYKSSGKMCTVKLRLIKGSDDDKWINSRMNGYLQDPSSFTFIEGEFIKRLGDGKGNITSEVYQFSGGVVQKVPASKENVEGDTNQAVSEWQILFGNGDRALA